MAQGMRRGGRPPESGPQSNLIYLPKRPDAGTEGAVKCLGDEPLVGTLHPDSPIASISPLPPVVVSIHLAMERLSRFLPGEVGPDTYLKLACPPRVKLGTFPGGIEFYDIKTARPVAHQPGETLAEIDSWVWGWYFSAIEVSAKITARYIDRQHPEPNRLRILEAVIRDPSSYSGHFSLDRFLDALRNVPAL